MGAVDFQHHHGDRRGSPHSAVEVAAPACLGRSRTRWRCTEGALGLPTAQRRRRRSRPATRHRRRCRRSPAEDAAACRHLTSASTQLAQRLDRAASLLLRPRPPAGRTRYRGIAATGRCVDRRPRRTRDRGPSRRVDVLGSEPAGLVHVQPGQPGTHVARTCRTCTVPSLEAIEPHGSSAVRAARQRLAARAGSSGIRPTTSGRGVTGPLCSTTTSWPSSCRPASLSAGACDRRPGRRHMDRQPGRD